MQGGCANSQSYSESGNQEQMLPVAESDQRVQGVFDFWWKDSQRWDLGDGPITDYIQEFGGFYSL